MTLFEQLSAAESRMNEIAVEIDKAESLDKIKELEGEYSKLQEQRGMLQQAMKVTVIEKTKEPDLTLRNASGGNGKVVNDPRGTVEYRKAFMEYVQTGKMPAELRVDATTTTTDLTAIIPSTISSRIIETLDNYGEIFKRIFKSNVKGGYEVAISSIKPVATWVAEGTTAEKQKMDVTGKVSFGYHKLQIKLATTLEATVVSLDTFEGLLAKNMARAIVVAIEEAVFKGTGAGQPIGLLVDTRIVAGQKIDFLATDASWNGWKTKLFANIKSAYDNLVGNAIYMNKGTWDKYIDGMVDDRKQPIARVTYGLTGAAEYRFAGKPVILVDYLKSFDAAATGEVFLVFGDLGEWDFNSNMQLTYKKYTDEDTDEIIEKMTLIADGKVLDPAGFVLLKKAVA